MVTRVARRASARFSEAIHLGPKIPSPQNFICCWQRLKRTLTISFLVLGLVFTLSKEHCKSWYHVYWTEPPVKHSLAACLSTGCMASGDSQWQQVHGMAADTPSPRGDRLISDVSGVLILPKMRPWKVACSRDSLSVTSLSAWRGAVCSAHQD